MNLYSYLYQTATDSFRICVMSGYRRDGISQGSCRDLAGISQGSHKDLTGISQGYRHDLVGLSPDSHMVLAIPNRFLTDLQPIYSSPWLHSLLLLLLRLNSKKIHLCIILVKSKMNNESTIQYLASYALTYLALSAIDRYCKK